MRDLLRQIGVTKSGKPVYATYRLKDVQDFTSQDHTDAFNLHYEILQEIYSAVRPDWQAEAGHHSIQADKHAQAGWEALYFENPLPGYDRSAAA
jgi:hypothetical protein